MKKSNLKFFVSGMLVMFLLMGSTSVFATPVKKNIQAAFDTIKVIMSYGASKTPVKGSQVITYNSTVYVPIGTISDSINSNVTWDSKSGKLTIGGVKVSKEETAAIYKAIDLNIQHMNDKDLDGYMSDLSDKMDKSITNSTANTMTQLFGAYDLKTTLVSESMTAYQGNTCEVRLVLEIVKTAGSYDFTNNRTTQIQKLIKENGKWKLAYSYIEKFEAI